MKRIRECIAILLALSLFLCTATWLGWFLMPYRTQYGCEWDRYLQEEENSIDVLFFGSSLCYCDVIPAIIWEETGLHSFVMAGPEQTIPTSYYYMAQALQTQKPALMVLEATGMFYPQYTNYTKANIGYMPWGCNRLEAIFHAAEQERQFGLLFPIVDYHSRWITLSEEDIARKMAPGKSTMAGYTLLLDSSPAPTDQYLQYEINDNYRRNLTYVEKIQNLCQEKGVDLLLYIAPAAAKVPPQCMEVLSADLNQLGVRLLDCADYMDDMDIDYNKDWYDGLHFNLYGAEKFSRWMANLLQDDALTPVDADNSYWQERLDYIQQYLP